jgi:methylenetetrahydrofolate reductase (NADPH)
LVDAINATSMAGGVASVDSLTTSDIIRRHGSDPTMQICGRDVTPNQFTDQLAAAWSHGVRNVFCLTGDWNPRNTAEQVAKDPWPTYFPMESSQMLYEARSLREHGRGGVTNRVFPQHDAPRFFIGGAINPCSSPQSVVFSRLAQKVACGVDFIQTQMVLDVPSFQTWVAELRKTELLNRVFLLASVPVILSARALEVCATLPGVQLPSSVQERLMKQVDAEGRIDAAGLAWAEETCLALRHTLGVDGIHLMLLGGQWDKLADWVAGLRKQLYSQAVNREAII